MKDNNIGDRIISLMEKLEGSLESIDEGRRRPDSIQMSFNYVGQIAENWILLHYCTLYGRNVTKRHWQHELETQIANSANVSIGDNSFDTRLRALTSKWVSERMGDPEVVYRMVRSASM